WRESEPQTSTSYAIARPRKMIATHSTMRPPAASFAPAENVDAGLRAAGANVRPNTAVTITLIATRVILIQNESAVNSRTGSPITSTTPVTTITTRPLHIHGANRAHTAENGSSARMRPITRNAIMRLETNTTPMVTM